VKKALIAVGVLLALAGGAFVWWSCRPAERVDVPKTDRELKKGERFPHELFTKVLKKHSKGGFVDYAALKADRADLDAYLGHIAKFSPEAAPEVFPKREDRLAYAINAYNAYILKAVVDHYPVTSVKQIGTVPFDVFKKFEYPFGGKAYSLEGWETKARGEFNEPRLHFALNCASLGCPRLPDEAFEPGRIEEQLAREAKTFVTEERNVKVAGGTARLSSIFKWYRGDFEGWQASQGKPKDLLAYIREAGGTAEGGEIEFVPYDWGLNDLKR
jgi:hypothetical protein